jgi:hypothetical protein
MGLSYPLPNSQWPILLLFGKDVFSLVMFLLIENALEGDLAKSIWFTILAKR